MKILAFIGSPRKNGNLTKIIEAICEKPLEEGCDVRLVRLYDANIKGCLNCKMCKSGEVDLCVQKDMMTEELIPAIIEADCIIIGTPVYMGHISGVTKVFVDRWFTFFDNNFRTRHIKGKKLITVTTSMAPAGRYTEVSEYLSKWFIEFFQLNLVGKITAGGLEHPGDILKKPEILEQARRLGELLLR